MGSGRGHVRDDGTQQPHLVALPLLVLLSGVFVVNLVFIFLQQMAL